MFFSEGFKNNLYKNTLIDADKKILDYILKKCKEIEPYKKVDNKGRYSAYFTFYIYEKLVTIVADGNTGKILTGVLETRWWRYDESKDIKIQQ